MTASQSLDLQKLQQLVEQATNPRQKALYQGLLEKAQQSAATESITSFQADPPQEQPVSENNEATPKPIFQAVGIVRGEVNFPDDGKCSITIDSKKYPLYYAHNRHRAFHGLRKEIENSGERERRLVVYPRAIHFPSKQKPHQISFQLVGFEGSAKPERSNEITEDLEDFEFKLCGLWQFIPVYRGPCISIFRNFKPELLDYIKQADPLQKTKTLKASHLPLLWRDSPVPPFRFNPRLAKEGKEQGHPAFIQVKARFLPPRNAFGFIEQLGEPQEKAPSFLKASKKDKAAAKAE